MQVKSIAECSKRSILQYFQPSLKIFVLSIFEWLFYTDFTVLVWLNTHRSETFTLLSLINKYVYHYNNEDHDQTKNEVF